MDGQSRTPNRGSSFSGLLLAVLLASSIGDEITQIALVFQIAPAGSGTMMAGLLLALLLPGAIVAPYAGKLVDERDAAMVLVGTSTLQALVVGLLAVAPSTAVALAGAGILSLLFAFGGAATFALIPIVGAAAGLSTARVNSAVEFASGGGAVIGPVVGGALVAAGGVGLALMVDAATFSLLALVTMLSGLRRPAQPSDDGWAPRAVLASYGPVLRRPGVLLLLASLWVVVVALAIADAVYVFLVTRVLGLGPLAYGLLVAAWATAYVAGAWIGGRLAEVRPSRAVFAGDLAMAAAFLSIGLIVPHVGSAGTLVVAVAFVAGGIGNALRNVAVRTMIHTGVPVELHGRAAALYGSGTRLAEAGGFVIGGIFGPTRVIVAYVISGFVALLAAIASKMTMSVRLPAR